MQTLTDLYAQHSGYMSDKWASYLPIYDRLFQPYRDRPISLLEIGIQNGGSLQIWNRFFPHATKLVGCDIDPRVASLSYDSPKVAVVIGDITSPQTIAAIERHSPGFDLVIDDASHRSDHIISAFQRLFPLVNPGGLFVSEDLHCAYYGNYQGGLFDPRSSIEYFKLLVDAMNAHHWSMARNRLLGYLTHPRRARILNRLDVPELKKTVRSVQFFDSMCVVEKADCDTCLGKRIFAGNTRIV